MGFIVRDFVSYSTKNDSIPTPIPVRRGCWRPEKERLKLERKTL